MEGSTEFKNVKYKCKVSSVLNKDVKQFGKDYMFDDNDETCWCSEQGSPQWIAIQFEKLVQISGFCIQFQGGFVGQDCEIVIDNETGCHKENFYPDDVNKLQKFTLKTTYEGTKLRITFNNSTDFFGRIVLYKLALV